jgi:nicotinamidase-related amidase
MSPPEDAGYVEEKLELDPGKTAFLLVDVYGPNFDDDSAPVTYLGERRATLIRPATEGLEKSIVVEKIRPSLDAARSIGLPIIYASNSAPKIELMRSVWGTLTEKVEGTNVDIIMAEENVDPREYSYGASNQLKYSEIIRPREGDYYIRKHMYSSFFETRLDGLLRNLKIENIVAVGFAADVCLQCTLIDAMYRNYRCILLRDCTLAQEWVDTEVETGNTKHAVRWIECYVGNTSTSRDFIDGCKKTA